MSINDLDHKPVPPGLHALERIRIDGNDLEYQLIPAHQTNRPPLVFLHEGLGCIAMWRDFPARVAAETGCQTLIYSRYGYGQSDVLANPPLPTRRLHHEAQVVLPDLLERLGIVKPLLIGHSDGASIALIHAGSRRWDVAGLALMAPHVFVEDMCVDGIEQAQRTFHTTDQRSRLARYHRDPDKTFQAWCGMWLNPEFRRWSIEEYLGAIRCPILAIQGYDDEYASMEQIRRIAAKAANVELLELADCRHSPYRDQPEVAREAIVRFVTEVT